MSEDDLPNWVIKARSRKGHPQPRVLEAESWLSQIGTRGAYRDKPRFGKQNPPEFDVSAMQGEQSAEQAAWIAFRRPVRKGDTVRLLRIGLLENESYRPTSTPSRSNPLHVGIFGAIDHREDSALARNWWDDPRRVTLDVIGEMSEGERGDS